MYPVLFDPVLCNGSTTDFDSVSLGSIPSAGANFIAGRAATTPVS